MKRINFMGVLISASFFIVTTGSLSEKAATTALKISLDDLKNPSDIANQEKLSRALKYSEETFVRIDVQKINHILLPGRPVVSPYRLTYRFISLNLPQEQDKKEQQEKKKTVDEQVPGGYMVPTSLGGWMPLAKQAKI